jgi:hypothetical protein
MTLKSLRLSVLLAGLVAAGFAAAQTPTAVPAAPVTRAEVKAQAKTGMTNKTGEGVDVAAPKKKVKAHHAKARHHVKAKKMKHHRTVARKSMKTGEGTDLGKK